MLVNDVSLSSTLIKLTVSVRWAQLKSSEIKPTNSYLLFVSSGKVVVVEEEEEKEEE